MRARCKDKGVGSRDRRGNTCAGPLVRKAESARKAGGA